MAAAAALVGGLGSALGGAAGAAGAGAGAAGGAAGGLGSLLGGAGGAGGAAGGPGVQAMLMEKLGQKGTAGGAARQKQGMEEGQPDQGYIDMSQPMGMQAQQSMMNQMGAGQRIQSPSGPEPGLGLLAIQLLNEEEGLLNSQGGMGPISRSIQGRRGNPAGF